MMDALEHRLLTTLCFSSSLGTKVRNCSSLQTLTWDGPQQNWVAPARRHCVLMRQNLKTSPQDIQYVDACENFQIRVSCLLTERSVRRSKNQALDHRMDVWSPCTRAMSSRGNHQREYKLVRTSDTPSFHTLVPYSRAAIPTEQTRVGSLLT